MDAAGASEELIAGSGIVIHQSQLRFELCQLLEIVVEFLPNSLELLQQPKLKHVHNICGTKRIQVKPSRCSGKIMGDYVWNTS